MLPVSIQLDKNNSIPMYLQLANQLEQLIKTKQLFPGSTLPSIRKLASFLGVNTVTIVSAYKHLETMGLIQAKKGSGYFILGKESSNQIPIINHSVQPITHQHIQLHENEINFASATPDPSIFPITAFKNYLNIVLDRDQGYAFGYQESNGYAPLRESLCTFLKQNHFIEASPDYIQIVSGAQQGIDIIAKALLNSKDHIIVECPTYTGALAAFHSREATIHEVSLEKDGLNLEELENLIQEYQPKLLYLMSKFQNPSTISYSEQKIKRVIELAEKYNFYIVEDDSMSEICFNSSIYLKNFKSLDPYQRVIYIKSFSKLMMPGLRIGFMVVPPQLSMLIMNAKHHTDISSSGLIQRTVDLYLREGDWTRHIIQMKDIYQKKYELMLSELNTLKKYGISFDEPKGGLHFWVKLPSYIDAKTLCEICQQHSLLIMPGSIFTTSNSVLMKQYVRLSFAACTEEQVIKGISIIENILKSYSNQQKTTTLPII